MEELGVDADAALEALQKDLAASEGPLVEEVPNSAQVLVTFVYIGEADAVCVASQLLRLMPPKMGEDMVRVPGTDVWHLSIEADPRVSTPYQFQLNPPSMGSTMEEIMSLLSDGAALARHMTATFNSGRPDPFNPNAIYPLAGLLGGDPEGTAPQDRWESILTLPAAEPFPFIAKSPLRGALTYHVFNAAALPGDRTVSVYTPPDYDASTALPVVIILDGEMAIRSGRIHHQLDEMITARVLPPLIAVFWHNLTIESRMSEMACNPALPEALADELLPWLRSGYAISPDREGVVIAGISYGGLASAWFALTRPDALAAAVVDSPSLWFAPRAASADEVPEEPEWLTRQYENRAAVPVRIYLGVGMLEDVSLPISGAQPVTMVDVARRFRDILVGNGYDLVGYREEPAGHDIINFQRVLARALISIFGKPAAVSHARTAGRNDA